MFDGTRSKVVPPSRRGSRNPNDARKLRIPRSACPRPSARCSPSTRPSAAAPDRGSALERRGWDARVARLAWDERGALVLEYVVVTMVGLMIAMALVGLGVALVQAAGASLQILYSEYP